MSNGEIGPGEKEADRGGGTTECPWLDLLPREVLQMILNYFTTEELSKLLSVCRSMNQEVTLLLEHRLKRYQFQILNRPPGLVNGIGWFRDSAFNALVPVTMKNRLKRLEQLLEEFREYLKTTFGSDSSKFKDTSFVPLQLVGIDNDIAVPSSGANRAVMEFSPLSPHWSTETPVHLKTDWVLAPPDPILIGWEAQDGKYPIALVDAAIMVECLLKLIRDIRSGGLFGFDIKEFGPTDASRARLG